MPTVEQKTLNSDVILYATEHFAQPLATHFSADYWQSKQAITGQASGRGTSYFFQYNTHEYVLRHYRRGGLIGKILNDSYLFTGVAQSRPWQEFKLLQHMQQLNLPSPEPVAALLRKKGLYYQADLISLKIANAKDLYQILLSQPLDSDSWQKIGNCIAQFHNQQIYHHDLNIHNIMLDNQIQPWLIDFDKCAIKSGSNWKSSNIARLKRSFEKEQKLNQIHWQESDWLNLLMAYQNTLAK
jgi:3-deoxy-D-manno-octulosonic acid kinase